jgi:GxxExxY protein
MGTAPKRQLSPNAVSRVIVDCAMRVHSALGPGLLESAYEACLAHKLRKAGLRVETQVALPVVYDGIRLDVGYRIDILVEDAVIVEIKACDAITAVHQAQLMSYLKLSGKTLGLLINFHVAHLKNGIKRIVNGTGWE